MREIQFENRHPDELAVPGLYPRMKEHVHTPNGNVLTVLTTDSGVSIGDYALRMPDKFPLYMFGAWMPQPGLLRAIVRSRAPGDWPHRKHPDIRPAEQMKQAVDYLDTVGKPVKVFRSKWTVGDPFHATNAMFFRRHMNDPELGALSVAERQGVAALRTPTGKMMTLLGFVLDIESVIDYGNVVEADFIRE